MRGKLEQQERLRSEIPPTRHPTTLPPWLPILVIHIRAHVKTRQSQSYKFEKIVNNSNFARNFTYDTLCEVAW